MINSLSVSWNRHVDVIYRQSCVGTMLQHHVWNVQQNSEKIRQKLHVCIRNCYIQPDHRHSLWWPTKYNFIRACLLWQWTYFRSEIEIICPVKDWPFWCWRRDMPGWRGQYRDSFCPGSNDGIDLQDKPDISYERGFNHLHHLSI